jgi:hypothetical protein
MNSYDLDALADVYIATMAGTRGNPRILWRMTVRDAMAMCSDDSTQGIGRGGPWAMHWTQYDLPGVEKRFELDDGRFIPLMERLGVKVVAAFNMLKYPDTIRGDFAPLTVSHRPTPTDVGTAQLALAI